MHHPIVIAAALATAVIASSCSSCSSSGTSERKNQHAEAPAPSTGASAPSPSDSNGTRRAAPPPANREVAVFAGGCFWCMEKPFESLSGVDSVTSGYTGGEREHPSYDEVSAGDTDHVEAVRIVYDPSRVDYERLLEVFWHNIDPTQADGQFCDEGAQYRTAIFAKDAAQRRAAKASLAEIRKRFDGPVHIEIGEAGDFWIAEDYHQDFYRTHTGRYERYRASCGRDARLRELWGEAAGH